MFTATHMTGGLKNQWLSVPASNGSLIQQTSRLLPRYKAELEYARNSVPFGLIGQFNTLLLAFFVRARCNAGVWCILTSLCVSRTVSGHAAVHVLIWAVSPFRDAPPSPHKAASEELKNLLEQYGMRLGRVLQGMGENHSVHSLPLPTLHALWLLPSIGIKKGHNCYPGSIKHGDARLFRREFSALISECGGATQ